MSKAIIVPDIHGRDFWRVLENMIIPQDTQVVMLGDYLDPYPYEFEEMGEELFRRAWSNAVDLFSWGKGKPNVHFLLGNHDAHYLTESPHSRYDYAHSDEIRELLLTCGIRFQIIHQVGKVLFSHAPLTVQFLETIGCEKEDLNGMADDMQGLSMLLRYCSAYRGGSCRYSSPLWADIEELANNPELETATEYSICGHTQQAETGTIATVKDTGLWCACVDSRAVFETDTDNPAETLQVVRMNKDFDRTNHNSPSHKP